MNAFELFDIIGNAVTNGDFNMKRVIQLKVLFLYNLYFVYLYTDIAIDIMHQMRRSMFRLTWAHEDEMFEEYISVQESNTLFDFLEGNIDSL